MNPSGKGFELFSFEFSLPRTSCIACPNCGYQIYSTILHKVSISKTLILFCCGSVIYWNYLKDPFSMISMLTTAKDLIQNGIANLLWSSSLPSSSTTTTSFSNNSMFVDQTNTTNVLNQYYQCSKNSIHNQLIVNNNNNNNNNNDDYDCNQQHKEYQDEIISQQNSNDFSSLNLSPLNSIGTGTLEKLDGMLDEVKEIKMYVNDSCNELVWFNNNNNNSNNNNNNVPYLNREFFNRRISDGEISISLPSLEWDLNDVNLYNSNDNDNIDYLSDNNSNILIDYDNNNFNYHNINNNNNNNDQSKHHSIIINDQNYIDDDQLSRIIFNKDFEFNDEKFFRMKKQYVNLKQRLKFMSKHHNHHRNGNNNDNNKINNGRLVNNNNLNSYNYRKNRDSAFFEEL